MSKSKKDNDGFLKDVNIDVGPEKKEPEETPSVNEKTTKADKEPAGVKTTHLAWWLIPIGLLMATVVVWNSSIELGIAILVAAVVSVVIICLVLASKKRRSRQRDGNSHGSTGTGSGSRVRRSMFRKSGKSGDGRKPSGGTGSKGGKSRKNSTSHGSGSGAGKSRNPFRSKKNKNGSPSGNKNGSGGNTGGKNKKNKTNGTGSKTSGNGRSNRYPHKGGRLNPLNKGKKGTSPKEHHQNKADDRRARIDAKKAKEDVKQAKYDRKKDKQDRKDAEKLRKINRMDAKAAAPVKPEPITKWSRNTLNRDTPRPPKSTSSSDNNTEPDSKSSGEEHQKKTSKPTVTAYVYNPEAAKKWRETAPKQKGNTMSSDNNHTSRATVVKTVQDVATAAHEDGTMWKKKSNDLHEAAVKASQTEGLEHTSHGLFQQSSAAYLNGEGRQKFASKLIDTAVHRWGRE